MQHGVWLVATSTKTGHRMLLLATKSMTLCMTVYMCKWKHNSSEEGIRLIIRHVECTRHLDNY